MMKQPPGTLVERITDRCEVGDCWIWLGGKTGSGYGAIRHDGKNHSTHRAMWQELVGPIPDGYHIDHLCRVRACCNPDHLEPVPPATNVRRALVGRRWKTCKRGHEWNGANTYVYPDGHRQCRACLAINRRKTRALQRAETKGGATSL